MLGANKKQLVVQFLTEAILVSLVSLGTAIVLIEWFLPLASPLFGFPLKLNWTTPQVFFPLLGIALCAGLLGGVYPSVLLSRLKTIHTFKSNFKIGGNNLVTKGSMVFQFILSIGLLSCAIIIFQQQRFIQQRNLGFDQEEVVVVPTHAKYTDTINTDRLVRQFRAKAMAHTGIVNIAGVSWSFNRGNQAQFVREEDGTYSIVMDYRVDPNYLTLLDIELLEGRNFSEDIQTDYNRSIIVNEAFLKKFEVPDIESYRLPEKFDNLANGRILGVVKDYHYNHLRTSINPMMMHMNPEGTFQHILVKIKPDEVQQTLAHLKDTWQAVSPDKPFEFSFLDEDIQRQYEAEDRWGQVISGATALAIVIAMLGLFGLVTLALTERTKEIGIRKVLGASLANIISLFSLNFLKLLLLATLLATPGAFYLMQRWLRDFEYRIDIQWWVFALAGAVAIFLAISTLGLQSMRAARANPIDSLRNE